LRRGRSRWQNLANRINFVDRQGRLETPAAAGEPVAQLNPFADRSRDFQISNSGFHVKIQAFEPLPSVFVTKADFRERPNGDRKRSPLVCYFRVHGIKNIWRVNSIALQSFWGVPLIERKHSRSIFLKDIPFGMLQDSDNPAPHRLCG
jgi:hypothetical protein